MPLRWWDRIPKKLTVLVVGLVVQVLPVPQFVKEQVRNLVIAFLGAQGLADLGKGKAVAEVQRLALIEQNRVARQETDVTVTRNRTPPAAL